MLFFVILHLWSVICWFVVFTLAILHRGQPGGPATKQVKSETRGPTPEKQKLRRK
jgi:hypothetical protein